MFKEPEERIVRTKEELDQAIKDKVKTIIVEGELVKNLEKASSFKGTTVASASAAFGISTLAVLLAGVTGGASLIAAVGVGASGSTIAVITAISLVGLASILALNKNYTTVDIDAKNLKLILKRK